MDKKKLEKDIDEIKTPSNRALVRGMFWAIFGLVSTVSVLFYIIKADKDSGMVDARQAQKDCSAIVERREAQIDRLNVKYDSLLNVTNEKTERENEMLHNKINWQDSVKLILQTEIKNALKRKK